MSSVPTLKINLVGVLTVLLLSGLLWGCGQPAQNSLSSHLAAESVPKETEEQGQQLFQAHCMGCHLPQHLQKGGPIYSFVARQPTSQQDAQKNFLHLLRLGSPNSGYMRQFSPQELSDDDALALYVWLNQEVGR